MDDTPLLLCATFCLMPALLPRGDESVMNFEGLASLSTYFLYFAADLRAGR
jgi:hypothetical protein